MPMRTLAVFLSSFLTGWIAVSNVAAADDAAPLLRIETGRHSAQVNGAAVDAAEHILVTVSDDRTARIWSLPALRPLGVLRPAIGAGAEGKLYAVSMSPDGALVAVGGFRAEVLVFDLQTHALVHAWTGQPGSVLA